MSLDHLRLLEGDITRAEVDAIVNAANPVMLGGGGVDGAIHRAAGPALYEACKAVPADNGIRCPTGEARITPAGKLPCRYVIHTVGPVYDQATNPKALLECCYLNALELALAHDCKSVAFPAISCGVYGYPLEEAADVALSVCKQNRYEPLAISFYLFGEQSFKIWQNVYEAQLAESC